MKRIKIILVVLLSVVMYVNAKNSYYYYNGERISLLLCDDSVNVYTNSDK